MGSCSPNKIFDPIRKRFVTAFPEEIVRQQLLQKMIGSLGYPKELLVIEKDLRRMPHLFPLAASMPDRRADILCFAKGNSSETPLFPLLLVECKDDALDQKAVDQVLGYNYYVGARFVALVSPSQERTGYYHPGTSCYQFIEFLPSYSQLLESYES